jgi:2-hydroxychromene-2-carboxylate isomerase
MYIVQDAKREADRLGIPFGRICDPLGPGIERCLATFHAADRAGRGLELARSLFQGIWSEALDATSYVDMRKMVERAGIEWSQVAEPGDGWRTMVRDNGEELGRAGLWGVPSYRVGSWSAWGQDRIPMLADRLRRHRAAGGAAA